MHSEDIRLPIPNLEVSLAGYLYGSAPARLLLIHGRGSCAANLAYLQEALCLQGVATIAFDQVGNGNSTAQGSVTLTLYVDALAAAIKLLTAQGKITLPLAVYGASRGANTALMLAKRLGSSCSSLLLCVPAFYRDADLHTSVKPNESVIKSIKLEDSQGMLESAQHIAGLSPQTRVLTILAEADLDVDNRVTRALLQDRGAEYVVKESGHVLRQFFKERPQSLEAFVKTIARSL